MIEIPALPEGIADENDLCNGVYNDDAELANLAWKNQRLHAAINYVKRAIPDAIFGEWGAVKNSGAHTAPSLLTSTYVRVFRGNAYYDCDVRNLYKAPEGIVATLQALTGIPVQVQPFVYEAELAGPSPIGAEVKPSPWGARRLWRNLSSQYKVGDRYEALDGWYDLRNVVVVPGQGPFGMGRKEEMMWEKGYSR